MVKNSEGRVVNSFSNKAFGRPGLYLEGWFGRDCLVCGQVLVVAH